MIEAGIILFKPENISECEKIHKEGKTHLCFYVYHGDMEGVKECVDNNTEGILDDLFTWCRGWFFRARRNVLKGLGVW